ncbi:unnamed protein product [Prorocentrum cordatum]|uniref:CDT1 Geminin-binding domain-containing protein n=1 Tax=Prorocentrum cordatum TaxID=2364126 RepID=A0ABN9R713_9DINO|nr:unnamed protein product [Polarella glacialis]
MDVARSIAALVAASKRKDSRRKAAEAELDTLATALPRKASKVAELSDKLALLDKLFNGLEFVLGALAGRQCRPTFPVVKDGVERMTGRDFTEERLGQVWAAAGDMLDVKWTAGELEVLQLAADGEARAPLGDEQAARAGQFRDALLGLEKAAAIPCRTLPARHSEPRGPAARVEHGAPRREPAATPSAGNQGKLDFQSRGEMLKARILAREQAAEQQAAWAAQVSEVELKLRACEDALRAHAVVQQLLVRAKGTDACCTEIEVLTALCGTARNRRALDPEAARAALATLVDRAADWFTRDVGKFTGKPFLQRILNGSGANAAQQLRLDIEALTSQRLALLAAGPGGGTGEPDAPAAALEEAVVPEQAVEPETPAARPKRASEAPSSDARGGSGGKRRRAPATLSAAAAEEARPAELEQVRAARPQRAAAAPAAAEGPEQDPAGACSRPRRAAAAAALERIAAQAEIARPRARTTGATRGRGAPAREPRAPEARRRIRGKSAGAVAADTEWA